MPKINPNLEEPNMIINDCGEFMKFQKASNIKALFQAGKKQIKIHTPVGEELYFLSNCRHCGMFSLILQIGSASYCISCATR